MKREDIVKAYRTLRQLASDPQLKKAFKSPERKALNDTANVVAANIDAVMALVGEKSTGE